MRILILFCAAITLSGTPPAIAKVASVQIHELIASSDAIVVAKVTEVLPEATGQEDRVYASAVVQRTLKGSLSRTFRFLASPDWICSTAGAVKDETALFFLVRLSNGTYIIQHAGRGRMPFRVVDSKTYVTFWDDVVLPKDAPTIPGTDERYAFIKSVELQYIESLIKTYRTAQIAFHVRMGFELLAGDGKVDGVPVLLDHAAPGEHRVCFKRPLSNVAQST